MKKLVLLLALAATACTADRAPQTEASRWKTQAAAVTITRDDWGIPHIRGRTDADAVFGLMYAQAEDDFNRIETNYLNAMGRLAESEGEAEVWRDLRMKIYIHPDSVQAQYAASPAWLKSLMVAWADGLNYYLFTHSAVHPRVIGHFEPWMALTFSEGSIGGDIESISLKQLEAFYGGKDGRRVAVAEPREEREPTGSNAFAVAPSNTADHKAMLLINPHTSFYFRAEVQVTSDEGLNAYGAVTWGQFFVYQGFNAHAGWMHPSSGADFIDEYAESVTPTNNGGTYAYGTEQRPLTVSHITVPYKTANGMATRDFTVYRTHHGPIVRADGGKWISVKMMQEPVKALTQSFTRTKATGYGSFRATMELHTNSSNNTVFADDSGNIAYFHANFIPRRDPSFDWLKPVDGSNPATEWKGLHGIDDSPHLLNPANGWLYNANNWPYSAAGPNSPKQKDFPAYMDKAGESPRGRHAVRVLSARKNFTMATLRDAAYDPYLTAFEPLLPTLFTSYDAILASNPLKAKLAEQIAVLRNWDRRWSVSSVATSLANYWGDDLMLRSRLDAESEHMSVYDYMASAAASQARLDALAAATDRLVSDFGTWKTPWGEINRFQRLSDEIEHPFSDAGPSIPVGFTSSKWGSLASFGAKPYRGSKKWFGTSGNSFVAIVQFGDSVRAMAITAGGASGDKRSKHFNDQAQRYSTGDLREVYFYPNQLKGHVEQEYHPGK